jgi:hypothetical protein
MAAALVVVGVGVRGTTVAAARWAVSLASAPSRSDRLARVCGGTVDTVNVGSRASACPPFNIALRERGHCHKNGRRPRSRRVMEVLPFGEITFLTFFPLISISHLNSTNLLLTNQAQGTLHHDSQLRTIRYNDHDTTFYFKSDSCLGPFISKIIGSPLNPYRLSVL